jgi:hypothetical protein
MSRVFLKFAATTTAIQETVIRTKFHMTAIVAMFNSALLEPVAVLFAQAEETALLLVRKGAPPALTVPAAAVAKRVTVRNMIPAMIGAPIMIKCVRTVTQPGVPHDRQPSLGKITTQFALVCERKVTSPAQMIRSDFTLRTIK